MAQRGCRRPSSAISEELGRRKQVGRARSAPLRRLQPRSYRLHLSGRHGVLGHPHSACLLYRKSFKCIKLIISVTRFQLIPCVQSDGLWAWVPSRHVGEEASSLKCRVKIQLSLGTQLHFICLGTTVPRNKPRSLCLVPVTWPAVHLQLLGTQYDVQACKSRTFWNPRILPHLAPSSAEHMGNEPRLDTCLGLRHSDAAAQSFF